MKNLALLTLAALLSLAAYPQSEKIDWIADLDFLAKELPERHFNLFTVKSPDYFQSSIRSIQQQSQNLPDYQVALKIQRLIAQMGDSHTRLNYAPLLNPSQILPIQVFWASDGLFILHTTSENEQILGAQLLSINGHPISTLIDSLSTLATIDNQAMVKIWVPQLLPSLQIMELFGLASGEQAELTLKTKTAQNQSYTLHAALIDRNNRVSAKPDSFSFVMKNERQIFTDCYYPDEKIYHILYNKCMSKETALEAGNAEMAAKLPSFKDFEDQIWNTLTHQPVAKIIFDLRNNDGGNSAPGTALIERLAPFLADHPTIKTYVVLGRYTFSSAFLNAMDFKRLTTAQFIGEATSGKPNHFGEVQSFQLPSSHLWITYSTKYFQTDPDDLPTLAPDVEIEMSFSDLMKGIDPIYEWVKRQ